MVLIAQSFPDQSYLNTYITNLDNSWRVVSSTCLVFDKSTKELQLIYYVCPTTLTQPYKDTGQTIRDYFAQFFSCFNPLNTHKAKIPGLIRKSKHFAIENHKKQPIYMIGCRNIYGQKGVYNWNQSNPSIVEKCLEYIKIMSEVEESVIPSIVIERKKTIQLTSARTMPNVSYGNAAISFNYVSPLHLDTTDFLWSALSVLKYGVVQGGYFLVPKYKLAFAMNHGDFLFWEPSKLIHGTYKFFTNVNNDNYRIAIATQLNQSLLKEKHFE